MQTLLSLLTLAGASGEMISTASSAAAIPAVVQEAPQAQVSFPEDFQTVISLVKATGLDQALVGLDGDFTLFAPSDAAFKKLPAELMAELGKPENVDTLKAILLYHVVPARVPSSAAVKATSAPTVEGSELSVELRGKALYIDEAMVIATDLEFAGGVVHAIDSVLVPPAVAAALAKASAPAVEGCATVFALVELAGLNDALAGMDSFTLFAPTDKAFAALPAETVELLTAPENREALKQVLLFHVVGAKVESGAAVDLATSGGKAGTSVKMLHSNATLMATNAGLTIAGASIVRVDIELGKGVVHVIDQVMIPADLKLNPLNPNRVKLQAAMVAGTTLWASEDWAGASKAWSASLTEVLAESGITGDAAGEVRTALKAADMKSGREAAAILHKAMEAALASF